MFDLGMWELMLVGVVGLLVLGPDKLPKAARTAGYWVRRARQSWHAVRNEIERELAADEFRRSIRDTRDAMGDSVQKVRESGERIQHSITGHVPGLNQPGARQPDIDQPEPARLDTGNAASLDEPAANRDDDPPPPESSGGDKAAP